MLHPKTHTMDDYSTVMLGNIDNDSRFLNGGGSSARKVSSEYVVSVNVQGLMHSCNRSRNSYGSTDVP